MIEEPSAVAEQHPAPPAPRPLSVGAVSALVLAVVLALVALMGFWWVEVVPLLVAAAAWPGLAAGRRRGAGLAVAASVIALGAGILAFTMVRAAVATCTTAFERLLDALHADDRTALRAWALPGDDPATRVGGWHERFAATEASSGAYMGSATVDVGWSGPGIALLAPPHDVEPADGVAGPPPRLGTALWFRGAFARARLWVALVFGPEGKEDEGLGEAMGTLLSDGRFPFVREVRFFRPK